MSLALRVSIATDVSDPVMLAQLTFTARREPLIDFSTCRGESEHWEPHVVLGCQLPRDVM